MIVGIFNAPHGGGGNFKGIMSTNYLSLGHSPLKVNSIVDWYFAGIEYVNNDRVFLVPEALAEGY